MGQENGWVAMSVAEHLRRARDPRFTAVVRIEHAALGMMNKVQHAPFGQFQLAEILGHDLDPGERKLAGDSTVRKAIKDAITLGILDPRSTKTCLVVPVTALCQWQRRDSVCQEHRIGPRYDS